MKIKIQQPEEIGFKVQSVLTENKEGNNLIKI